MENVIVYNILYVFSIPRFKLIKLVTITKNPNYIILKPITADTSFFTLPGM